MFDQQNKPQRLKTLQQLNFDARSKSSLVFAYLIRTFIYMYTCADRGVSTVYTCMYTEFTGYNTCTWYAINLNMELYNKNGIYM